MSTFLLALTCRRSCALIALIAVLGWAAGCGSSSGDGKGTGSGAKSSGGKHAVIETDNGPIELEFFESDAPKAVENFRLLAERGYYDGVTFHRVIKGFMIQGGDPAGNGTGGESAWGGTFEDEIAPDSPRYREGYRRGIVAMANAGRNTNGSQFFIMHADYPLPPNYTIFGTLRSGEPTLDAIATAKTGAQDRPADPVAMTSVKIEES